MEQTDGQVPGCKTGQGCIIPPLDSGGKRASRILNILRDLYPFVGADTVFSMYEVDEEDVDLMRVILNTERLIEKDNKGAPKDG